MEHEIRDGCYIADFGMFLMRVPIKRVRFFCGRSGEPPLFNTDLVKS